MASRNDLVNTTEFKQREVEGFKEPPDPPCFLCFSSDPTDCSRRSSMTFIPLVMATLLMHDNIASQPRGERDREPVYVYLKECLRTSHL